MNLTFNKLTLLVILTCIIYSCNNQNEKTYEHDIGYIDPESALGDKDFKTCDNQIFEYYNSFPDGGYKYGKKALRDSVMRKYNYDGTDSGYLTFRFVVNCEGIAGRYQIIENDLNYKPTQLNKDLVSSLFSITKEFKEWRPVILNEQSRDYYIYITYKLRDGKIIEILP